MARRTDVESLIRLVLVLVVTVCAVNGGAVSSAAKAANQYITIDISSGNARWYYNPKTHRLLHYTVAGATAPLSPHAVGELNDVVMRWAAGNFDARAVGGLCCNKECTAGCVATQYKDQWYTLSVSRVSLEKWVAVGTAAAEIEEELRYSPATRVLEFLDSESSKWKAFDTKLRSYSTVDQWARSGFANGHISYTYTGRDGVQRTVDYRIKGQQLPSGAIGMNDDVPLRRENSFAVFKPLREGKAVPVQMMALPHYPEGVPVLSMASAKGKAFHWWADNSDEPYDALTRGLMAEINNDEHWTNIMLDAQHLEDVPRRAIEPTLVENIKSGKIQDPSTLAFLDTRCVASAHAVLSTLTNTRFAGNVMQYLQYTLKAEASRFDDSSADFLVDLLSSYDGDAVSDDKHNVYYGFSLNSKDPLRGGKLGHVFCATQEGGPGPHPPVFFQTNYYLMTMRDFTRGRPRIRSSLANFGSDVAKFLASKNRLQQKMSYLRLFGGAHMGIAKTFGDSVVNIQHGIEASWMGPGECGTAVTPAQISDCLSRLPAIPFTFNVLRYKMDHDQSIRNVQTGALARTIQAQGDWISRSGHRSPRLVVFEHVFSAFDRRQWQCCVAQPTSGNPDSPNHCVLVQQGTACPTVPPPYYGSYVADSRTKMIDVSKEWWAKQNKMTHVQAGPCELPYNTLAMQDSRGMHRVLSSPFYGKQPQLNINIAVKGYGCAAALVDDGRNGA